MSMRQQRSIPKIVQRSRKLSREQISIPSATPSGTSRDSTSSVLAADLAGSLLAGARLEEEDGKEEDSAGGVGGVPSRPVLRNPLWAGKVFKSGVVSFNMKPKEGVAYFVRQGMAEENAASVAELLLHAPGLSRKRIGEYIGRIKEFNTSVLSAYLALMEFGGHSIDEALRVMLCTFRLPGEAQCIDMVVQKFGDVYCSQNPGIFAHPDVAYVLSFSLIMLNTDLHNDAIVPSKKMTLKQWHSNNRGINQGEDLPPDVLDRLYAGIKAVKIDMSEGDMNEPEVVTFMAPEMRGWLFKKSDGGMLSSWHKWWFVLTDGCLYYFKLPKDSAPRCIIPLENCEANAVAKSKTGFVISCRGGGGNGVIKSVKREAGRLIQGKHKRFELRAEDSAQRDAWIGKLAMGLQEVRHPVYEYIKTKKEELQRKIAAQRHMGTGALSGWMHKKGQLNTSWKRRFFVLYTDSPPRPRLYYFTSERGAKRMAEQAEDTAQGFIELDRVISVQQHANPKEVKAPEPFVLELRTAKRTWLCALECADVMTSWLDALVAHIEAAPTAHERDHTSVRRASQLAKVKRPVSSSRHPSQRHGQHGSAVPPSNILDAAAAATGATSSTSSSSPSSSSSCAAAGSDDAVASDVATIAISGGLALLPLPETAELSPNSMRLSKFLPEAAGPGGPGGRPSQSHALVQRISSETEFSSVFEKSDSEESSEAVSADSEEDEEDAMAIRMRQAMQEMKESPASPVGGGEGGASSIIGKTGRVMIRTTSSGSATGRVRNASSAEAPADGWTGGTWVGGRRVGGRRVGSQTETPQEAAVKEEEAAGDATAADDDTAYP